METEETVETLETAATAVRAKTVPGLVSVVLPAHNEEEALADVVEEVVLALGSRPWEIVVVDDGSRDGTWRQVVALNQRHRRVSGVRLTRNFGHQAAVLAGLKAARGEAVITMDADGQHPPSLLPTLLERWQAGVQVVQCVRTHQEGASLFKRTSSRLFYVVLSALAGVRVREGTADFRLLSRSAIDTVLQSVGPTLFLRGLIPWLGLDTEYVSFRAPARRGGRTQYNLRRMVGFSLDGILNFSIVPLRFAMALGGLVSSAAFAYLVYVAVIRLTSDAVVPGWASTAGLLSLLGGMQLLTMGILGEYLGRTFMATASRPHYVVRQEISSAPAQEQDDGGPSPQVLRHDR